MSKDLLALCVHIVDVLTLVCVCHYGNPKVTDAIESSSVCFWSQHLCSSKYLLGVTGSDMHFLAEKPFLSLLPLSKLVTVSLLMGVVFRGGHYFFSVRLSMCCFAFTVSL